MYSHWTVHPQLQEDLKTFIALVLEAIQQHHITKPQKELSAFGPTIRNKANDLISQLYHHGMVPSGDMAIGQLLTVANTVVLTTALEQAS